MKKLLVLLMALVMCLGCLAACGGNEENTSSEASSVAASSAAESSEGSEEADIHAKSEGVMTWAQYDAAELEAAVVIEAFVQGKQSWWDNKCTVYAQDKDGAYFMYEMACTEEDYAKLTVGTKIKVTGYKAAWSGEVEIIDCTFEIMDGNWVAEPTDVTDLLGKDELIKHQNKVVSFKGMTVVSIAYQNETQGEDIYVTLSKGDAEYTFCVEKYLTGKDTEVYKAVEALKAGDVIDVEGFLYWYEGVNTHITKVAAAQ